MRYQFLFIFVIFLSCFADKVILKNDKEVVGIIVDKNKDRVKIDLGFGKTELQSDKIKKIIIANKEENQKIKEKWQKKYKLNQRFVPKNLTSLVNVFKTFITLNQDQEKYKNQINLYKTEINELKLKINNNDSDYARDLKIFKKTNYRSDPDKYLSLHKSIEEKRNLHIFLTKRKNHRYFQIDSLKRKIDFTESLKFQKEKAVVLEIKKLKNLNKNEKDYLKKIEQKFKNLKYGKDAIYLNINSSYGNCIVVDVLINNHKASLVFDTGASLVVLTKEFARKIGLNYSKNKIIKMTIADGREIDTYHTRLKTVSIKNVEEKNVEATILAKPQMSKVDGLLGMSFLKFFDIKVNRKTNQLILRKIH